MLVRFWGTRGSLAKPGPGTVRYGGNTSCVEVRSAAGTLVVIDCGTGAHDLGQALMAGPNQPLRGHLLISHTHWDHIQGIPFFQPLFEPGNEWDIYAPHSLSQSIRDTLAGQMQYTYFPVTLEALGAKIRYHDLVEGVFQAGDITVRSRYLNHPALTLGYRLEADCVAVVYSCDHEPFSHQPSADINRISEQDHRHADFLRGADLVIHDAQYTATEYVNKIGWGHSTAEFAVDICSAVGVKQLALTHHDPMRDDDAIDQIIDAMRDRLSTYRQPLHVFAAAEGETIELEPGRDTGVTHSATEFSAVTPIAAAIPEYSIFLGATVQTEDKHTTTLYIYIQRQTYNYTVYIHTKTNIQLYCIYTHKDKHTTTLYIYTQRQTYNYTVYIHTKTNIPLHCIYTHKDKHTTTLYIYTHKDKHTTILYIYTQRQTNNYTVYFSLDPILVMQ